MPLLGAGRSPRFSQRCTCGYRGCCALGSLLALAGLAACADQPATSPSDSRRAGPCEGFRQRGAAVVGQPEADADQQAPGSGRGRISGSAKAELRYAAKGYDAQSPTEIFANDRTHTPPTSGWPAIRGGMAGSASPTPWIPCCRRTASRFYQPPGRRGRWRRLPAIDPGGARRVHRGGDAGVAGPALLRRADRAGGGAGRHRPRSARRLLPRRARRPSPTYAQPADVVHAGWQPAEFFEGFTPGWK